MLSAGIRATGEVDVNRLIERHSFAEIIRERDGLSFRVGGGKFAAGVPRAGDKAAEQAVGFVMKSDSLELAFNRFEESVGHVGDKKVLPRGEPRLAGSV